MGLSECLSIYDTTDFMMPHQSGGQELVKIKNKTFGEFMLVIYAYNAELLIKNHNRKKLAF